MSTYKSSIIYDRPGNEFWKDYGNLWSDSYYRSAFQSPHYLGALAGHMGGKLAIFQFFKNEELWGATFFSKNGGTFQFLSDLKTDHNFFVLHKDCDAEDMQLFFDQFFNEVKSHKWALTLNNQPSWANYWGPLQASLNQCKLYKSNMPYSVCPVFQPESTEALLKRLSKSKNTRYKRNKLKKELDAEFEVMQNAEDLDNWVEGFANSHVLRWSMTNTPSEFEDKQQRVFLKDAMRGWIKDGILVRFAIKTNQGRLAYCIGLIERDTLIHHSHTYDRNFGRFSPGKVLLAYLGEWMAENKLTKLDFGDGNEAFKYKYANQELGLHRVFVAPNYKLLYILKSKIIKVIRQNEHFYNLYLTRIKPYFS